MPYVRIVDPNPPKPRAFVVPAPLFGELAKAVDTNERLAEIEKAAAKAIEEQK